MFSFLRRNNMSIENNEQLALRDLKLTKVGKKDATGQWTWETKVDVITSISILGNIREVAKQTKVPFETILQWRKQPWYEQLAAEIKQTRREETGSKLDRIVQRAIEKVEDRLENGDFVLNNKTGQIVRKPVGLKDASTVLKDVLDKQIKLETLQIEEKTIQQSVPDILKTLAAEFAKFNKNQAKQHAQTIDYTEVIGVSDAIHDERETRLQEGGCEIHQQA